MYRVIGFRAMEPARWGAVGHVGFGADVWRGQRHGLFINLVVAGALRPCSALFAVGRRATSVADGYLAECRCHVGVWTYLAVNPVALGQLCALC